MVVDTPEFKETPMIGSESKFGGGLSRASSYRSVTGANDTEKKSVAATMLDDSAVMQALNHTDLAEAALSPTRRRNRRSDDSLFSIESSKAGIVPQLNMEGLKEKDGYISPPSMSPIKSSARELGNFGVIGKIKNQVKVMKQHRFRSSGGGKYDHDSSLLNLNYSDYVSSARVRSFISKCVDEVSNATGLATGSSDVESKIKNESLIGIFEHLVNGDGEGELLIEDIRDVFRCLMAELELSMDR